MGFHPAQLADAVANGLTTAEAVGLARRRPAPKPKAAPAAAVPAPAAALRFEVVLPLPPRLSDLTVNAPGRGRVTSKRYAAWKEQAAVMLLGAPAVRTPAQVTVRLLPGKGLGDFAGRFDVCNREKATLDAIVAAGILPDDDHEYLPRVVLEWDCHHRPDGPAVVRVTVETVGVDPDPMEGRP